MSLRKSVVVDLIHRASIVGGLPPDVGGLPPNVGGYRWEPSNIRPVGAKQCWRVTGGRAPTETGGRWEAFSNIKSGGNSASPDFGLI